jgi:hypothetical protein
MIETTSSVFGTKTVPHFPILNTKELRDQVKWCYRDLNRILCPALILWNSGGAQEPSNGLER